MRIVIVVCLALIAGGIYVLLKHPQAALVGIPLTVIPALILVQAFMLGFARLLRPPGIPIEESQDAPPAGSDLMSVFYAYRDFKLFLARLVGFAAIAFGIFTLNVYYMAMGAVLVTLFFYWDRMTAAEQANREKSGEMKVTSTELLRNGNSEWDEERKTGLADRDTK